MAWAYFQNQAAFTAYHDTVCAEQGIPRPGRRQSDGTPQIRAQWTDAWVNPIQVKGSGNVTAWVAHVPDVDAARFGLLSVADSAVTVNKDTGVTTVKYANKTYTFQSDAGFTWRKAKPATVTVDGVTYNTTTGRT